MQFPLMFIEFWKEKIMIMFRLDFDNEIGLEKENGKSKGKLIPF